MIYSILSFKASGAGAAVFLDKLYSIASSSTAFSSISEGCLSAGSEGPASALAWLTAASTLASFVLASICIFEASAIFPEGIELEAFTDSSTSSTLAILFLLGVAAGPFVPSALSLLPKGLKLLTFLAPQFYQSSAQLTCLRVPSALQTALQSSA
jgi:hypothetical protein